MAYRLSQGLATDQVGSMSYLAPEIVKKLAYCPLKSDIFSIGVTLYFLITGNLPWSMASAGDINYNAI